MVSGQRPATSSKSICPTWARRWSTRWRRCRAGSTSAESTPCKRCRERRGSMSSLRNFTLALAAALVVAACSGGKGPADGAGNAAPKAVVLGFSQIGAESEWRTANTLSIQSAAKEAGIDLRFSDAQQKQENQI